MAGFAKTHRLGQGSGHLSGFLSAFVAAAQRKPCATCMAHQIGRFIAPDTGRPSWAATSLPEPCGPFGNLPPAARLFLFKGAC